MAPRAGGRTLEHMNPTRMTLPAAGVALAFTAADNLLMTALGGPSKSVFNSIFFFMGIIAMLTAVVCVGLSKTRGRRTPIRVLVAIGGVLAMLVVTVAVNVAVALGQPTDPGWAWGEVNLWIVVTVVFALSLSESRRQQPSRAAVASDFR